MILLKLNIRRINVLPKGLYSENINQKGLLIEHLTEKKV